MICEKDPQCDVFPQTLASSVELGEVQFHHFTASLQEFPRVQVLVQSCSHSVPWPDHMTAMLLTQLYFFFFLLKSP